LLVVFLVSRHIEERSNEYVAFYTNRGLIRTTPHMKHSYEAAIQFMKSKAAKGESVLSVPEDTSLYFLSDTQCPTRIFQFSPGAVAPGKVSDEVIQEIDRAPVQYLIWSNRKFEEFGVPIFGQDFDRPLGDYLRSHYRPIGPLVPDLGARWAAEIWERKLEAKEN
jgi:hypothetical protein